MTLLRRAFTLIELLVVISIMGIMMALLIPAVQGVIISAKENACQNNMKQLASVVMQYCQQYDGSFPMGGGTRLGGAAVDKNSASDWLYVGDGGPTPTQEAFDKGLILRMKLVGTTDTFCCPIDQVTGMARVSGALVAPGTAMGPTSYVINASITYGENDWGDSLKRRSRRLGDFKPRDFMFIEESSGTGGDPPTQFKNACMMPDGNNNLTGRHHGGGYVACMDGHVEWMKTGLPPNDGSGNDNFKQEMDAVRTGGGEWWKVAEVPNPAGSKPATVATRWNP